MTAPEDHTITPQSFPGAKDETAGIDDEIRALTTSTRTCKGCGNEARIVSNNSGVNAHCNTCKIHWPIANTPLSPESPITRGRGLRKITSVEPDWNMAFDSNIGSTPNDKIGPKGRK